MNNLYYFLKIASAEVVNFDEIYNFYKELNKNVNFESLTKVIDGYDEWRNNYNFYTKSPTSNFNAFKFKKLDQYLDSIKSADESGDIKKLKVLSNFDIEKEIHKYILELKQMSERIDRGMLQEIESKIYARLKRPLIEQSNNEAKKLADYILAVETYEPHIAFLAKKYCNEKIIQIQSGSEAEREITPIWEQDPGREKIKEEATSQSIIKEMIRLAEVSNSVSEIFITLIESNLENILNNLKNKNKDIVVNNVRSYVSSFNLIFNNFDTLRGLLIEKEEAKENYDIITSSMIDLGGDSRFRGISQRLEGIDPQESKVHSLKQYSKSERKDLFEAMTALNLEVLKINEKMIPVFSEIEKNVEATISSLKPINYAIGNMSLSNQTDAKKVFEFVAEIKSNLLSFLRNSKNLRTLMSRGLSSSIVAFP